MRGIVRRQTLRQIPGNQGPWPTPWAVNVRAEDPIDRRLRGGSRPGLTKFVNTVLGSVISDMASINVSSATEGAREILVVLVDSIIRTIENGTVSTPVAYLTNESGEVITDEDEVPIVVSEGATISSGFLVSGQQKVFAVTSSGISKFDPKTGQLEDLEAVAGTIPTNCTFGAMYRDRLCMSGQDNAIYMSRQGVYGDFYAGAEVSDQQRQVVQSAYEAEVFIKLLPQVEHLL